MIFFSKFIREKYHYGPDSDIPSYYAGSVYDVSLVFTPILGIVVVSCCFNFNYFSNIYFIKDESIIRLSNESLSAFYVIIGFSQRTIYFSS